jgi:hypothetical protein
VTHCWSQVKQRGLSARYAHVAVSYQHSLFVFGGISDGKVLDDFKSYHFGNLSENENNKKEKKKWSNVESKFAPKSLWGASAVTSNHYMYLFGGMDAAGNYSNHLYQFNFGIYILWPL